MKIWSKSKEKILEAIEKSIIKEQTNILEKARKNKAQAIEALLLLQSIYVLDMNDIDPKEKSKELTKADLVHKTHLELVTLLEYYIEKLNEEVGAEQ